MRNGTYFQRLCDSFMSRLSDFLQTSLLMVHHAWQQCPPGGCQVRSGCGSIIILFSSCCLDFLSEIQGFITYVQCWPSTSPGFAEACPLASSLAVSRDSCSWDSTYILICDLSGTDKNLPNRRRTIVKILLRMVLCVYLRRYDELLLVASF